MNGLGRPALALLLVAALPAAAFAQRGGNAGGRQGGSPNAGAHAAFPGGRAAPVRQPAPVSRPVQSNAGGFNFNQDLNGHPAGPQPRPVTQHFPTGGTTNQRPAPNLRHAPDTVGGTGPFGGQFHGRPISNPRHWNGAWNWNRGVAWQPAPTYWGGGFWGPFALAGLLGAVAFGSIVDDQNQVYYPSYEVEPDSPGAQMLQNYGLQQTPCGPPDLVVIWGPDNSVICAYPNATVGPGNYELDPATLTIVSQGS